MRYRKPKLVKSIMVEVSGAPQSWIERTCFIDGDERQRQHQPTWGKLGEEMTWYCMRCGKRMEHPLRY